MVDLLESFVHWEAGRTAKSRHRCRSARVRGRTARRSAGIWSRRSLKVCSLTVSTISQRLIDEHGFSASRSSLRRWIAANHGHRTSPVTPLGQSFDLNSRAGSGITL